MAAASTDVLAPTPTRAFRGWRLGFRSLQFKASLLVVLLVVFVTLLGTAISMRATASAMLEKELVRTRDWATFLTADCRAARENGDVEGLDALARRLITSNRGVYFVFADSTGRIITAHEKHVALLEKVTARGGRQLLIEPLDRPKLVSYTSPRLSFIDLVVPVYHEPRSADTASRIAGYLRFALDITDTQDKLRHLAGQYAQTAIIVVLLLVPCSVVVTRHVVAPVKELARTAQEIAKGSMDARACVSSRDEIGELAQSFNRMANRVTESQLELLRLNAELEERVRLRTRELAELAAKDPLTGLYNRRHFGEVMTREFAAAERYGDDLTCLMFDVDHFKTINDTFGHRTGDAILITLAQAISSELRQADVAARFGGDEFIVLMPQTSADAAMNLAERVNAAFDEQTRRSHPGVHPTLSIGVASLRTTRAPSSEALMHEADVALYAAKEAGRNRTVEATAHA
jgi:diguanylate cyclase (GGDEF)-like protein